MDIHKRLRAATGPLDLSVAFELAVGETLGLYGPSGVGKTSTLRMIAGLLRPDGGQISFAGERWFDEKTNLAPGKRGVGFVFQGYALFPHLTVLENLRYASRDKDARLIDELLESFQLGQLADRRPTQLSGGQAQRVALARTLVQRPRLMLLDEPLNALDTELRQEMQSYLLEAKSRFGITTILITHDPTELKTLADRVLVLGEGQVIFDGLPGDYFPPAGVLSAEVISINVDKNELTLRLGNDLLRVPSAGRSFFPGQRIAIVFTESGVSILR
ncbi:ABC transporter ATP-binding protein [Neolewinella antarctica]|uniref:Molybdate transport system ATP-binding protein n=1 Tax=Neolewinella antarctica TaxID=442734 RepID=A0ABX0X954_9BACT|nr:ABC transporter ATP-binding protein [Neolewinella antarctica]NJC25793.1 molybdate transport system ATP-binding protein [Neolewinella antarctica]